MPLSPFHATLAADLNRFWLSGDLPDDSELKALADQSHGGDIALAVVHAAAQITRGMPPEHKPSAGDIVMIEKTETVIGKVAISSAYALPACYGKDFDEEDLELFDVLDQAIDDSNGLLGPIHRTTQLVKTHRTGTVHISGWLVERAAD